LAEKGWERKSRRADLVLVWILASQVGHQEPPVGAAHQKHLGHIKKVRNISRYRKLAYQCCGSGSEFFHPRSRVKKIPDSGSGSGSALKNLNSLNPKIFFKALGKKIWDVHPGSDFFSHPGSGSRSQKSTGSRIHIRNTELNT
jgi:hypothetical protein